MQFQLNTDTNIQGDERLVEHAETLVRAGLGHLTGSVAQIG